VKIKLDEKAPTKWCVHSETTDEHLGRLEYLGRDTWEYTHEGGKESFTAAGLDSAHAAVQKVVDANQPKTESTEVGVLSHTLDRKSLQSFVFHQLDSMWALACVVDERGAYAYSLVDYIAKIVAEIASPPDRKYMLDCLVRDLNSQVEKRVAANSSDVLGSLLSLLQKLSSADSSEELKKPSGTKAH
jgi:hypothetical protein